MRHAQGYHDVTPNGHTIHDPNLTPKGETECAEQSKRFGRHDSVSPGPIPITISNLLALRHQTHAKQNPTTLLHNSAALTTDNPQVSLLVASPMRRTLQTCLLTFAPCVDRGLKILAQPYAQEITANPSDIGSDVAVLEREFSRAQVDLSGVFEGWNSKTGEVGTEVAAIVARAKKVTRWLRDREEEEVVLVSHGNFAHFLTGEVDAEGVQTTGWWGDAELRSYTFVGDAEDPKLCETNESLGGRKTKSGPSLVDGEAGK